MIFANAERRSSSDFAPSWNHRTISEPMAQLLPPTTESLVQLHQSNEFVALRLREV